MPLGTTLRSLLFAPRQLPILGDALAMRDDPLGTMMRLAREQGGLARIQFGPRRVWLLSDPALIEDVLVRNPKRYHRRTPVYRAMYKFMGPSILTVDGEDWRKHRRIVQPAFHKRRLESFAETITTIADSHLARWSGELDVADAMMRLTLKVVSDTLLGTETDAHSTEIGHHTAHAQRYAEEAMQQIFRLPKSIRTPRQRAADRTVAHLDRLAYDLIDAHANTPTGGDDAVSMLLEARYEDGSPLPRERIRNELVTLIVAGHETTSNALSWTLMRLSQHPAVARRLRAEIDEVLGSRTPTFDDLPKLRYARCVFDEAMRLHPPVWATSRIANERHELGRETIDEHEMLVISPYVTHRRPELWDNPEGFDPERWRTLGQTGALAPLTFFPFGGGARKCVGEAFAYLEAILILAMIMQRLDLHLTGRPIVPATQITLGFASGLWMKASAR